MIQDTIYSFDVETESWAVAAEVVEQEVLGGGVPGPQQFCTLHLNVMYL